MGQELILSIPGKTFLAGEYLAITGGASFVISTYKCFEMHVKQGETSTWRPHPQSPAGRLLTKNRDFFQGLDLNFINPYGFGGFGASTAEFISLQALLQFGNSLWIEQERFFDLQEFLKSYRENSELAGPWAPSGADLVGQIQGGVSYFERNSGKLQKFAWPFHQLGFALLSTGLKLPTHEHLQNLKHFETEQMTESTSQIHEAFRNIDEALLLSGLRAFQAELERQDLVSPETLQKIKALRHPAIQFAKGCGALGADVILLVYSLAQKQNLVEYLQQSQCQLVATESDLAPGLSVKVNP